MVMRSVLLALVPAVLTLGAAATASAENSKNVASAPQILATSQVFKYPLSDPYDLKNLYGFNHAPSIARMADGKLIAAWFSGPFEASVHQVILASTSNDDGKTWSEAHVLQDTPRISDFDAAFIQDSARTWMFYSAGRWHRYPFVGPGKAEQEQVGIKSYKLLERHSDDSGKSWTEPRRILPDETGVGPRSNGIRLSTGELLLPVYSFTPPYASHVMKSSDAGQTWRKCGNVATPEKTGAAEPTIVEISGGRVLMALRTNDGSFWTSVSPDRGETWPPPTNSDLPANASSHHLFRLADGRIVLTHNPCEASKRTILTMRLSSDDGATWGEPLKLDEVTAPGEQEDVWSREVCYPSITQLPDGKVIVVWAWLEMSPISQYGIIKCAQVRIP